MADEDLKAELARVKAENERLKSQRGRTVSLKVSEKGGVSVYGLGRFPVTGVTLIVITQPLGLPSGVARA